MNFYETIFSQMILGANKITQATPTYFLIIFMIFFREIFLKNNSQKSLNFLHIILLKFMLKIW